MYQRSASPGAPVSSHIEKVDRVHGLGYTVLHSQESNITNVVKINSLG
jgi:hypothetical protein